MRDNPYDFPDADDQLSSRESDWPDTDDSDVERNFDKGTHVIENCIVTRSRLRIAEASYRSAGLMSPTRFMQGPLSFPDGYELNFKPEEDFLVKGKFALCNNPWWSRTPADRCDLDLHIRNVLDPPRLEDWPDSDQSDPED